MQDVKALIDIGRQLGLPQWVVGHLLGVSRQQLHYYMNGRNKPSPARAIKIKHLVEDLTKLSLDDKALRKLVDSSANGRTVDPELVRKAIKTSH